MQNFMKIDRQKTKLFSFENLVQCFGARLYMEFPSHDTWSLSLDFELYAYEIPSLSTFSQTFIKEKSPFARFTFSTDGWIHFIPLR